MYDPELASIGSLVWRHAIEGVDMPTRYRDAVSGEYITEEKA
jgi:hypothetical protein